MTYDAETLKILQTDFFGHFFGSALFPLLKRSFVLNFFPSVIEFLDFSGNAKLPPPKTKSCSSFGNISTKNSYLDQFWLLFMGQFWSSEQDPIFVQQYMVLCLFCLLGSTKKRSIQKFKNWELNNFGDVPFCEPWSTAGLYLLPINLKN